MVGPGWNPGGFGFESQSVLVRIPEYLGSHPGGFGFESRRVWVQIPEGLGTNPRGSGFESRRVWARIPEVLGSNPGGPGGSLFESHRDQYLNRRNKTRFLSPNEPKCTRNLFFRSKPNFSGQNRRKPLFRLKSTETGFSGQKPVFPANIDENHFSWPNSTKTSFSGQN